MTFEIVLFLAVVALTILGGTRIGWALAKANRRVNADVAFMRSIPSGVEGADL